MRRVIMVLAILGMWVSWRALAIHYSTGTAPCSINDVWDCGIVNHSRYSVFMGVPVALIGIIGYAFLGVTAMLKKTRVVAVASVLGLAFASYLAYVEARVLGVWCQYCVGSLIIISLITVLAIIWLLMIRRQ